jgi:Calx-beta domain-containing protein
MDRMKRTAILVRAAAALTFALALSSCGGSSGGTAGSAVASTAATQTTSAAAQSTTDATEDAQQHGCRGWEFGTPRVALCASSYTVSQAAGSVSVIVKRGGTATTAISVDYVTANGTAIAGTDYTAASGVLKWAENDWTPRTIAVPVSSALAFSGNRSFTLVLSKPSTGVSIVYPGSGTVTIAGAASATVGTLQLTEASYLVGQGTGSATITVTRADGDIGATSISYATANGTAIGGTDFTATSGTLQWASGDSAAKSFAVPISNAAPFTGSKAFGVKLSNATASASMGSPSNGTVTIAGDASAPVGSLVLAASGYTVAQNGGQLTVTVDRTGGSNGAVSVSYGTSNGTAIAGTDYTATSGVLQWADADTSAKTFSIPISNAAPFSGSKTLTIALSAPSAGAAIGNPGSATATISGDAAAPVGSLQLSASSYTIAQGAGSLAVSVTRTGGSSGAASVTYNTTGGSAVAGTDFTATSGTLSWADGDASSKTFSVPVSNATPFSGNKSFTISLSNAGTTGAALGSPSSAIATITGDAVAAVGSLQLSASSYGVGQAAGTLSVTVNRTGGSSGAVSVVYATADGTAVAGTDYTASNGTLSWASGDASSKSFSVAISNATPFSGSKAFTVALSGATGGATLSSPSSAGATIAGSLVVVPAGTLWVYYNGAMNWGGDWSFAASANYKDTSGGPIEGAYDIEITGQQWGGWQPYVSGNCQSSIASCFVTTPYKYLIFSAKPTVANQIFGSAVLSAGDTPDGNFLQNLSAYCSGGSNPPVGQWETCKVPLSAYSLTDLTILKFSISDQTGLSSNHYYLDNVGFTTN